MLMPYMYALYVTPSCCEQASLLRPVLAAQNHQFVSETPHASRIGGMLETPLKRHTFSKVCSTVALYIANVLGH